jgi:hypothetical protein
MILIAYLLLSQCHYYHPFSLHSLKFQLLEHFHMFTYVDLLPWPAVSSDLSPIEHVWDEISGVFLATKI